MEEPKAAFELLMLVLATYYQTDNGFYTRTYVQDGVVYGCKRNSPLGEMVALDSETGNQFGHNEKDRAQAQNLSITEKLCICLSWNYFCNREEVICLGG